MMFERARFHAGNLLQAGPRHFGGYVREKLRVARDGELSKLLGLGNHPVSDESAASPSQTGEDPEPNSGVQHVNDRATTLFIPEPYDGSVVIFKPQVNYASMTDPMLGWGYLAKGGVEVVELPVNPHAMLVEPFVAQLAAALKLKLEVPANQFARI
jgi:hypothetical protein